MDSSRAKSQWGPCGLYHPPRLLLEPPLSESLDALVADNTKMLFLALQEGLFSVRQANDKVYSVF